MNISVKNILKNIISSIIAIVIMFSLIITMGIIFFQNTLINDNTYKSVFLKKKLLMQWILLLIVLLDF